ncbi:septum formation protein [Alicyclobacillus sacchari]|uniref:dTTP/UTP pyrophosphatase n=1 Tax=Alicyclobacillus sacchari TaxID=392010 RepID=A0A4R8LST9_9BACL|nr:Maf family protein [Alicyclobacillus sacchari]TDY49656.1 septum formation protein [Alicyclobacillus sacchari]
MADTHPTLILASGSPRRRQLLAMLGVEFDVVVSRVDEAIAPGTAAPDAVKQLARRKANAVWLQRQKADEVIVAADTVVVMDGRIVGKPASRQEALQTLLSLAGKTHDVYTGVCVRAGERSMVEFAHTTVTMRSRDENWMQWYVATGEPLDKAGSYAIQGYGSLLVQAITGDYYNVVGLPLGLLDELMTNIGHPLRTFMPANQGQS